MFLLLNGALLLATVGSGMASHLGAARLLYSMGTDGALPRGFFASVHPRTRVPYKNVLLIGAIVLVGALTLSYERGAELLNFGALIAFMGVNAASVLYTTRQPHRTGLDTSTATLGTLGLLVCLLLWLSLGHPALLAGALWAALGIALYFLRRPNLHQPT